MNEIGKKIISIITFDTRSLALLRVCIGCIIILDILSRIPDAVAFYTDDGFLPRSVIISQYSHISRWSVYFVSGNIWFVYGVMGLALLTALSLIVGYRTRMSIILSWILLLSLHNRNEFVTQGGDNLFHAVVFWMMFLPIGSSFSLDSVLEGKKNLDSSASVHKSKQNKINTKIATFGTTAFLIQVLIANISAGVLKSGVEWTSELSATMYASRVTYLNTGFSRFFSHFPPFLMKSFTFYLKWVEIIAPLLLLIPFKNHIFRYISIIALILMLVVCGFSLHIFHFPLVWGATLLALIPSQFWDWVSSKTKKESKLTFYYDRDCEVCTSTACALQSNIEIKTCQSDPKILSKMLSDNTMVIRDENGVDYYEFDAVLKLMSTHWLLSFFVPFLSLPPFSKIGRWVYSLLARNRYNLSKIVHFLDYENKPHIIPSYVSDFAVCFLILYVTWWNVGEINTRFSIPQEEQKIGYTLGLNQRWDMFAPSPVKEHGWLVISGTLIDGTEVDVLARKNGKPSLAKEDNIDPPKGYRSYGWRKFFVDYLPNTSNNIQLYFSEYLCRTWNQNISGVERLSSLEITTLRQKTNEDGALTSPEERVIWRHTCFEV